ncbi:hypothetical protein FRC98_13290 [Lujinxingia vulgaris]|uniref:Flagellar motor switch protein FliN-like C-terminal domain-containing protein n=1 Tax=Lujinxingia vulgaris TaxID=2600176 RepID=A0A5C6X2X0_9DELT|nr:FliM/FliN family flagellar motor switch protein [Lujinxingia vulgaris]TXD36094.1 hypothetical protein FRC98_13290 [Lujinxingia vulgaris]
MDEKTQLLELPGWFQEMRREHQARADDEPTVVVSEALEAVTVRVEAVAGPGRPARAGVEEAGADEATVTMPSLDAKTRPVIDAAAAGEAAHRRVKAVQATREVRPWDRMRLASVTQAQARALADFVEVLGGERMSAEVLRGMEGSIAEGWRGVGRARVGVHWDDDGEVLSGGASTWWRVMPGWERGLVWVDEALARRWLSALELGHLGGEQAHGAVCAVLGEVFSGAMRRCGWPQVTWGVNPLPGRAKVELMRASRPPYVAWVLEVEHGGVRGQLRLAMPWSLVRMVHGQLRAPAVEVARWAAIPGVGRLSVGRVGLRLEEARGLGPGDVVVMGGEVGRGEEVRFEAQLSFGPRARWAGALRAGEGGAWMFEVGEAQDAEPEESTTTNDDDTREDAMSEAVERAEVEVEVVVGEVRMALGQLSRLMVGQVLETGAPVGGAVRLMVGEREVARGELVEVEGRLGVRVEQVGS